MRGSICPKSMGAVKNKIVSDLSVDMFI